MIALHTVIAIVVIVLLIIKVKVDPVIALIIGSLYLGLATGVGFTATILAITTGFGEIMAEVGLLMASPSETTLIVLATATTAQLIEPGTAAFWQIVTAIGLTITPLLAKLGKLAGRDATEGTIHTGTGH